MSLLIELILIGMMDNKHGEEKHQYSVLTYIYMEFRKMVTITIYARQQ